MFFRLLRPKSKMENNHLFVKIFALVFSLFCKIMNQNPKIFGGKKGTKQYFLLNFCLLLASCGLKPIPYIYGFFSETTFLEKNRKLVQGLSGVQIQYEKGDVM